jgi:hypothetical protein
MLRVVTPKRAAQQVNKTQRLLADCLMSAWGVNRPPLPRGGVVDVRNTPPHEHRDVSTTHLTLRFANGRLDESLLRSTRRVVGCRHELTAHKAVTLTYKQRTVSVCLQTANQKSALNQMLTLCGIQSVAAERQYYPKFTLADSRILLIPCSFLMVARNSLLGWRSLQALFTNL